MSDPAESSVIAFYGVTAGANVLEHMYDFFVEWFQTLGCPPDRAFASGEGFGKRILTFRHINARLRKQGFGSISYFSIYSIVPGNSKNVVETRDSRVNVAVHSLEYATVVARPEVATLTETSLGPISRKMIEWLRPEYGIGYRRARSKGPGYYALGICQGLPRTAAGLEEGEHISRWLDMGSEKRVWREGFLRDVYPWNFLMQPQLSAKVNGSTLEQWIAEKPGRGTLNAIDDRVSHWVLNDAEIAEVRPLLWDAGVIYDYRKFVDW